MKHSEHTMKGHPPSGVSVTPGPNWTANVQPTTPPGPGCKSVEKK